MILDRQRQVRVALRPLQAFLSRVQGALGLHHKDVTICLVSDAEIARMNQVFRKKRGPTDVLSFPAEEWRRPVRVGGARAVKRGKVTRELKHNEAGQNGGSERNNYLGDIAISPATARRNAKREGRPLPAELEILILHGVLHLLGYDHETDQGQMERLEQRLRRRFRLA